MAEREWRNQRKINCLHFSTTCFIVYHTDLNSKLTIDVSIDKTLPSKRSCQRTARVQAPVPPVTWDRARACQTNCHCETLIYKFLFYPPTVEVPSFLTIYQDRAQTEFPHIDLLRDRREGQVLDAGRLCRPMTPRDIGSLGYQSWGD